MKISTSQMYYKATSSMIERQAALYKTQDQLSTGRKILSPRDNPVDATVALMTQQSKGVNQAFMDSQATARDRLSYVDTQLGSVVELLQSALESSIQGGNGSYGQTQKLAIVNDLEGRYTALVSLANTKEATGEYLFAGNRTNVKPFEQNVLGSGGDYSLAGGTSVQYMGDDGQRQLQVDTSEVMATSDSGQQVFMRVMDAQGNLSGQSVFDGLRNMIDHLKGTGATSYDDALTSIKDSLEHISRIRTTVGARINQLDSLTNADSDLGYQYDSRLASLESLDYAQAISDLNQQQVQLQALQQSFAKTSQLSLFSLL